jgi:hypothetical protein
MGTPALDAGYLREKVVVWWVFRGENIYKSISNAVFYLSALFFTGLHYMLGECGSVWMLRDKFKFHPLSSRFLDFLTYPAYLIPSFNPRGSCQFLNANWINPNDE